MLKQLLSNKLLLIVLVFGGVFVIGMIADQIRQPGRWETANECLDRAPDRLTNTCDFAVTYQSCVARQGEQKAICDPIGELAPGANATIAPVGANERRATIACKSPYVPRTYPKQHKPSETTWGCGEASE